MDGKQKGLGVTDPLDEASAWAALRELVKTATREAVAEGQQQILPARTDPIPELVPLFLAEKGGVVEKGTIRSYAQHLKWLAEAFPKDSPAKVDVARIVRAAAAVATWGDTHRANVLSTAALFLRWAGRVEEIARPPKASRGAEAVIPDAVYRRCLDETRGDFRQLIRFLWETGCRPAEATGLTTDAVEWERGTIRVKEHKTRKKGKTRILYLAGEALAILKEQREKYADGGLLFRGQRGRRLGLQAMTMRFDRLGDKVGHTVTSYQFRHTWATRALKAGVPAAQVAAMLGHSSTAMVFKHYGHLTEEADLLRQQAEKVSRAG